MGETVLRTIYIDRDNAEIRVLVAWAQETLGKLSGEPEDCYPPEPEDIEIVEARFVATNEHAVITDVELMEITDRVHDFDSEIYHYDDF